MFKFCRVIVFMFLAVLLSPFNVFSRGEGLYSANLYSATSIQNAYSAEKEGDDYFAEAEKKEKRGDLNNALTLFGKAAFEYQSVKLNSRYANALMRVSSLHLMLKNYQAAENVVLNVILKVYTKMGSKDGEMNSYKQLGDIYSSANKYTQSLWYYTQQGIIAKQTSNKLAYIESVISIAYIKIKKREYIMASADLNQAESLAKLANTMKFKHGIANLRDIIKDRKTI